MDVIFTHAEITNLESLDFTIVENTQDAAILSLGIQAMNVTRTSTGGFMVDMDCYTTKAEMIEALCAEYLAHLVCD